METPISLSQIGLYNPQRQSAEITEKLFVARQKNFELLLNRIVQEKGNSIPQHYLIIGQRGMGKTTLLKRLEVELHKKQYSEHFVPLLFPEEQYNVKDLPLFWLNCLDALADSLELEDKVKYSSEISNIEKKVQELTKRTSEIDSEDAYKYFMQICRNLHRRPVLLIDNIGLVFNRLDSDKKNIQGQWALRKILCENGAPIIVSAGSTVTNDVTKYDMPFYDFFQIHYLKKLCFEEFTELLENLAERTQINTDIKPLLRKEKPRLQTLYHFTGGNPRTAVMLFKLIVKGFSEEINDDLDALVDEVTPLYKAKFEELPQQQQIIIDAIAMNWHAIPLKELSTATHLENGQLSPQLKRLNDEGWIETTPANEAKGNAYFISERFFNTWFLIRRGNRRQKKGVHSLSELLECIYGQERMVQVADSYLQREMMSSRQIMSGLSVAESKLVDSERKGKLKEKLYDAILKFSEEDEKILDELDIPKEFLEKKLPMLDIGILKNLTTKLKSEDAEFWKDTGDSLFDKKKYDKAIMCYKKAIELKPNYADAYNNMGNAYTNKGNNDRAIECYEKAIDLNLDDAKVYYNMGIAYMNKGNYDKAIEYYEKAIDLNPDDASAFNNIGITYAHIGNYDKAIECYEKAIELKPDKVNAYYYNMGNAYSNKENNEKAIECYEKAIDLNLDFANAYYNMGNAYSNKRNYEKAIECYEKVIELNPDFADAYYNMGNIYNYKSNYEKAIECYEKAIDLNPDDAFAYNNMGYTYDDKGNYGKAIECYEKAIDLNPDYAKAYNNMGKAYNNKGNYEKAIECYEKAIEIDPDIVNTYYNMGIAYTNKENYDKAIMCYEKAIELNPNDVEAYCNLQKLYLNKLRIISKENISEAKELFNQIKDKLETDEHFLHEALFELHNRNEGIAKEYLSSAIQAIQNELPKTTLESWYYFAAICLNLNYGSWLLNILEEKGYDIVLSPYYTAIQALEIEKKDSKNGEKNAELYLKNRAIEISDPARIIMERIRKYMS